MKKLFLFCTVCFAAVTAFAAGAVVFRSGAVLCAETSRIKPSGFKNLSAAELPEDPLYAAVTVKLDRGRKISIFDYSLKAGGASYPCMAVRDNGDGRIVTEASGGGRRRCTLFFVLDASAVNGGGAMTLVCNAPGGGAATLKFTDRGSRRFTPDSKIPDPGK